MIGDKDVLERENSKVKRTKEAASHTSATYDGAVWLATLV